MKSALKKRRCLRPLPGMLIAGALLADGFLWVCKRYDLFDAHRYEGWLEFLGVACTAAMIALLLLWWLAALTFRWQFQLPLRNVLIVFAACSIVGSWFAARYETARRQAAATNQVERVGGHVLFNHWLEPDPSLSSPGALSPEPTSRWPAADAVESFLAQRFLGDDYFRTADFVNFDDRTTGDAALGCLGEFGNFHGGVSLNHTAITDAGLARVARLKHLENLDISSTRVTDAGLAQLVELRDLGDLDLDDTRITDAGLQSVGQIAQLYDLRLNQDRITDAGFKHLTKLPQLRKLGASFTGLTDAGLESIGKLKHLDELWIAGTHVTDAGLARLTDCDELQTLCLDETRVTGEGIDCLRGLEHLRACSLNGAAVSDAGLKTISTLEHLEEFDIGSANISDVSLNFLTTLPNLQSLSIRACTIRNYATAPHARFQNLQSLDITSICVDGPAIDWQDWVPPACNVRDCSR